MRTAKALVIGAGAAYLFDPKLGRRRRRQLVDRLERKGRRIGRLSTRKARFGAGRARGLVATARRIGSDQPVATDDTTVLQRIRSDALRDAGVSTKDVEVDVEKGVATLRGSVESSSRADDLIERVSKVPGVQDVAAMIRVSTAREDDRQ
jgi:hypothetical protein